MSVLIGEQRPEAAQVSGVGVDGRPILTVLFKTTWRIHGNRVELAAEQDPLVTDLESDGDLLLADTDLFPYKPLTDIVVKGAAYSYGRSHFVASISVGAASKHLAVRGNRHAAHGQAGRVRFSPPQAIESVPLRYTHAYGGADQVAADRTFRTAGEKSAVPPGVRFDQFLRGSPFSYPRNPCGKGFAVTADSLGAEEVALPNLEDPAQVLQEDTFLALDVTRWPRMPIPQATDWMSYTSFPRIAYFGFVSPFETNTSFAEVDRGLVPGQLLNVTRLARAESMRLSCGASLGLQLPHLVGGEVVQLDSMHKTTAALSFRIPSSRPRLMTDGRRGTFTSTNPVLHTVVIRPDDDLLTLVWGGSAPALRPYGAEELKKMSFVVET